MCVHACAWEDNMVPALGGLQHWEERYFCCFPEQTLESVPLCRKAKLCTMLMKTKWKLITFQWNSLNPVISECDVVCVSTWALHAVMQSLVNFTCEKNTVRLEPWLNRNFLLVAMMAMMSSHHYRSPPLGFATSQDIAFFSSYILQITGELACPL